MDCPANSAPNRDRKGAAVSTYFITFACYGAWLHGKPGAIDRHHNIPGTPLLPEDGPRLGAAKKRMIHEPYLLDAPSRELVLSALKEACSRRNWDLLAAHVRSSHVHVVLQSEDEPEQVLNALKAYASRQLNLAHPEEAGRRRWARHGSTRYLWHRQAVDRVIQYVVSEQGDPAAMFVEEIGRSLPVAVLCGLGEERN